MGEYDPILTEISELTTVKTVTSADGFDMKFPLGAVAKFVDAAINAGFKTGDSVQIDSDSEDGYRCRLRITRKETARADAGDAS